MNGISFIIPTYNSGKTIGKCIESIINLKLNNYEIIVVNDGSIDDTNDILRNFHNDRIRIFTNENHGVSFSRNYGISMAFYDYLFFVDSDDYLNNVEFNENLFYDFDLVIFNCEDQYKNRELCNLKNGDYLKNDVIELIFRGKIPSAVWGKLFRRDIINKFNIRFDENVFFGEDFLFLVEYLSYSRKIKYENLLLYEYTYNVNSITKNSFNPKLMSFYTAIEKISILSMYDSFCDELYGYACVTSVHILIKITSCKSRDNLNYEKYVVGFIKNNYKYYKKYGTNKRIKLLLKLITINYRLTLFVFRKKLQSIS